MLWSFVETMDDRWVFKFQTLVSSSFHVCTSVAILIWVSVRLIHHVSFLPRPIPTSLCLQKPHLTQAQMTAMVGLYSGTLPATRIRAYHRLLSHPRWSPCHRQDSERCYTWSGYDVDEQVGRHDADMYVLEHTQNDPLWFRSAVPWAK